MTGPFDYSVVIPVYNGADYVATAIASAQAQSVAAREIIVVDNGSTDGSAEVARRSGAIVLTAPQRGVSGARNLGIEHATGEWIAFLDCDDIWHPDHVESLARYTSTSLLVTCPQSIPGVAVFGNTSGRAVELDPSTVLLELSGLSTSATMVQSAALRGVGGFDVALDYCEDLDLWLRLLATGRGVSTAKPTVTYTVRPGQASLDQAAMRRGVLVVVETALAEGRISRRTYRAFQAILAYEDVRLRLRRGKAPPLRRSVFTDLRTLLARPLLAVRTIRRFKRATSLRR